MYDLKSKISSKGKITEVLGNNTYLADCGNGPQHISGDVISRISDVAKRQVGGQIPEVPGGEDRHTAEADVGGEDRRSAEVDVIMDQDDVISVISDSSEDSDDVLEDLIPRMPVPRRGRRRRNADALGPVCEQRLRTRR